MHKYNLVSMEVQGDRSIEGALNRSSENFNCCLVFYHNAVMAKINFDFPSLGIRARNWLRIYNIETPIK